jgi:hypothetical protein
MNAPELQWLKKGQTYQAVTRDDGDLTIIEPNPEADRVVDNLSAHLPQQPVTDGTIAPDTKRAIAAYATELTKLYSYCYQQAKTELPEASDDVVKCAASSVFIACQRKFNLA